MFFGAAVLGTILTFAMHRDPGPILGIPILIGAVIAALGIRRAYAYLIIPMPAVTYLILAVVTGGVHDASMETSTAALGLSFLQWIGSGFFSIFAATLLVLLIFGGRMLASRQVVSGSFTMSSQRAASGRPGRALMTGQPAPARRESRAPWDDADPWYDRDSRDGRDSRGRDPRRDRRGDGRGDGRDGRGDSRDGRGDGRGQLPSGRPLPPDRGDRFDRGDRLDRGDRFDRGDRSDRGDRPSRGGGPARDAQRRSQPRSRGPRPGTSGDWR